MTEKITLTKQELEDIKITIKFREMVVQRLKQLNGLPKKVIQLEVITGILLTTVFIIIRQLLQK